MHQLPMDMVINICKHITKSDLLNVLCCCKSICENRNIIIFDWIKHTTHVGVLFKLPSVCHYILASRNTFLINEVFVCAAFIGRTDIVKSCLNVEADVNYHVGDALVVAARFNYMETVELLLECGADVHTRNDEALLCSIAKGNHYVTHILIKHGASIMSPAVKSGLQLQDYMRQYAIHDIQPWLNNASPSKHTKRTTLLGMLSQLFSAIRKPSLLRQ
jgi:hypothetical protein